MATNFQQIVLLNNRHKLKELVDKIEHKPDILTTTLDNSNKESLLFFINTICMTNDAVKFNELLNQIKQRDIRVNLNHEFMYYLVKENNTEFFEIILEFARGYLKQDIKSEQLGEYFNQKNNETTLLRAVKNQNLEIVRLLVKECGASVNLVDRQERTAVLVACGLENADIVKFLTENGADLNKTMKNGDTPLLKACFKMRTKNIEYLVNQGYLNFELFYFGFEFNSCCNKFLKEYDT